MSVAQYRSDRDEISFLHLEGDIRRNGILMRLLVIPIDEDLGRLTSVLVDRLHLSVDIGQDGFRLRHARLEDFLDARETLRDIRTRDTTDMEGTHRELGTRFTDSLRRDDSDRSAELDQGTPSEIDTVTDTADTATGLTGHQGSYFHPIDRLFIFDDFRRFLIDQDSFFHQDFLGFRMLDRLDSHTSLDPARIRYTRLVGIFPIEIDSFSILTVFGPNDNVLGHIDQTASQVSGGSGTKSGIRHTLTGTVRRDEVFENIESFLERTLHRQLDRLTGRTGHQTLHTGHLHDDRFGSTGFRIDHRVDRAFLVERLADCVRDLILGFVPGLDRLIAALLIRQETHIVLFLHFLDTLFG